MQKEKEREGHFRANHNFSTNPFSGSLPSLHLPSYIPVPDRRS
jgi:hypothetical protein